MAQDLRQPSERLEGWKEISEYLEVSSRTAQHYERNLNLPVYRWPGSKSRVWTYGSEIDSWKSQLEATALEQIGGNDAVPRWGTILSAVGPRRWKLIGAVLVVSGIIIIASALVWRMYRPELPADFRWMGADFVALNRNGSVIWRHAFPNVKADWYREDIGDVWHREADLDGDGRTEILLEYLPQDMGSAGVSLYCFSQTGQVKWVFRNRREVWDGKRRIPGIYWISNFQILPADRAKPGRIVVSTNHHLEYTNQIAVLDARGNVVGEYWHSGHLVAMAISRNDADDSLELLLAGVNNGYRQATLVILDPDNLGGTSRQPPGDPFQIKDMPPGKEKAIVRFPRTCISDLFGPFNMATHLFVTATSIEVVISEDFTRRGPPVIYHLDRALNVLSVDLSTDFRNKHKELELEGKLKHTLTPQEAEQLRQQVVVVRPAPGKW